MQELVKAIPDVEMFLKLEPEELAAKMLFLLRQRGAAGMFTLNNLQLELWPPAPYTFNPLQYPREKRNEVDLAFCEAWAWLEAQGLLVPAPGSNGSHGWRVLSRRAKKFASEAEFANYSVARMLRRESLHPTIADRVWAAFVRGEFDVAVFQVMKAVEVAVREASGLPDTLLGTKLMEAAFSPNNGPLTDMTIEGGERQGPLHLFVGAIACYKNPNSHRDVNLNDPAEAIEIILLANHLLRIVDARVKAKGDNA